MWDIYSIFMFNLKVTSIFGMSPYRLSHKGHSRQLRLAIWPLIYSIIHFLLGSTLEIIFLVKTYDTLRLGNLFEAIAKIQYVTYSLTYIVAHGICLVRQSLYSEVFQRLDRLPQYVFKTRHQISIMILTIFSLLFTLIFSCLNISVDISLSLKIIFFLRSIYNYFIFSSTLIRFSTLILCLRIQFETLNNEISSITSQHKMPISILDTTKTSSWLPSKNQWAIKLYPLRRSANNSESFAAKKVLNLCRRHHELCLIGEDINNIYSPQLLVSTASSFCFLTFGVYYFLCKIIGIGDIINSTNSSNIYHNNPISVGSFLFIHSFYILAISYVCSSTSEAASATSAAIHEALTDATDQDLRRELEGFSLQLVQRKLIFSACGFFPIDFTLVYTIVGAVTTYLVILMQFETGKEPDSKSNQTTTTAKSTITQ